MEQGEREAAANDFEQATAQNPDDPDIYYHRAQLHFILSEFAEAAKDYQKSIDLDKDFIFSHIQLGVTQYKMGSVASSMATFRRCMKNFDKVPDVYNYYGELLLDQQKYQEAVEKFDTAIEMEKATKPLGMNVLPLINKALAQFQWKQDFNEAEELCKKALISEYRNLAIISHPTNTSQSIPSATLPLLPWRNFFCSKARCPRRSSTSSAPPSCPAPKARSSTRCRTPRRRGRSSRCRKSTRSSPAAWAVWAV